MVVIRLKRVTIDAWARDLSIIEPGLSLILMASTTIEKGAAHEQHIPDNTGRKEGLPS